MSKLFILLLLISFGIELLLSSCCVDEKSCETKKIVDIGGCDRYAKCIVRFEDNTIGKCHWPLKSN